jgi:hypothetical protein
LAARSGRPPGSHRSPAAALDDALALVRIKLSEEEIALLEEPYVPHAVVGFG